MAARHAWLGLLGALAIPWASIGQAILNMYGPWREHTAAAEQILLMWLPLAGVILSVGWAVLGLHLSGVRRAWRWAVPLCVVAVAAQAGMTWMIWGIELYPT